MNTIKNNEPVLNARVQYGPETVEAASGGVDQFQFFLPTLESLRGVLRPGVTRLCAENEPDRGVTLDIITMTNEGLQPSGEFTKIAAEEALEVSIGDNTYRCTNFTLTGLGGQRAELALLAFRADAEMEVDGDIIAVDTWYDLVYGHLGTENDRSKEYGGYEGLRVALENHDNDNTYGIEYLVDYVKSERNRNESEPIVHRVSFKEPQAWELPIVGKLRVDGAEIYIEGDKAVKTPFVRIRLIEGYDHENPDVARAAQLLFVPYPQNTGDYHELHVSGIYNVSEGAGDLRKVDLGTLHVNDFLEDMFLRIESARVG